MHICCFVTGLGDDRPTEELVLLALCNLAVVASSSSSGSSSHPSSDNLLLQLVRPQLAAAASELQPLAQLLLSSSSSSSSSSSTREQQAQLQLQLQLQLQQPQQQQWVAGRCAAGSKAFHFMTSLVSGLPCTSPKDLLESLHKTPKPQPQQEQQGVGSSMQANSAASAVGGGTSTHAADTSSPMSDASTDRADSPASTGVPAKHSAAAVKQQHAAAIVRQLVAEAWPLASVARQVMSALMPVVGNSHQQQQEQQEAVVGARVSVATAVEELLASWAGFLSSALPAAVDVFSMRQIPDSGSSIDAGGVLEQQQQQVVVRVQEELLQLPAAALMLPCCLQLLRVLVMVVGVAGRIARSRATEAAAVAAGGGQGGHAIPAATATAGGGGGVGYSLEGRELLQQLTYISITASCNALAVQGGGGASTWDAEHVTILLGLTSGALQSVPASLAALVHAGGLEQLLLVVQAACSSYNMEQCAAALRTVQLLCCMPYARNQQTTLQITRGFSSAAAAASGGGGGGGLPAPAGSNIGTPAIFAGLGMHQQYGVGLLLDNPHGSIRPAAGADLSAGAADYVLQSLRELLEAGWGPRFVLALLLAAGGTMPPDVVLPIATCLHGVWGGVGGQRFAGWIEAAVLHLAPEAAPWYRQKQANKLLFLQHITEPACEADLTRFKRLMKMFCGGKKKGCTR